MRETRIIIHIPTTKAKVIGDAPINSEITYQQEFITSTVVDKWSNY
jgi:hypothetical protein